MIFCKRAKYAFTLSFDALHFFKVFSFTFIICPWLWCAEVLQLLSTKSSNYVKKHHHMTRLFLHNGIFLFQKCAEIYHKAVILIEKIHKSSLVFQHKTHRIWKKWYYSILYLFVCILDLHLELYVFLMSSMIFFLQRQCANLTLFIYLGAIHKWHYPFVENFDPSLPLVTHFTK